MATLATETGLITSEAPFIENARRHGELYIRPPYELYSEENHESWRRLYARMLPRWEQYANPHFQAGIDESASERSAADVHRCTQIKTGAHLRPSACICGYKLSKEPGTLLPGGENPIVM